MPTFPSFAFWSPLAALLSLSATPACRARSQPALAKCLTAPCCLMSKSRPWKTAKTCSPPAPSSTREKSANSHRRANDLNNVNFKSAGKTYDLFDYLALNRVAGLLILKNGQIVREDYELGIGPKTRWPSFSMGKSVVSTLIGAALRKCSMCT